MDKKIKEIISEVISNNWSLDEKAQKLLSRVEQEIIEKLKQSGIAKNK